MRIRALRAQTVSIFLYSSRLPLGAFLLLLLAVALTSFCNNYTTVFGLRQACAEKSEIPSHWDK